MLLLLWTLLVVKGVGFRRLGEIGHSDQQISLSLIAQREGSSFIDCYSFEWAPTLYLCIWPLLLVRGQRLAAQT
jgi:hypothetical protein